MEHLATFRAQLEYLPEMLRWVRQHLQPLPLEAADKNKFEVAAEEILVNIISYAYKSEAGTIELQWREQHPFIHLTFKDFGTPFNPLHHQKTPIKSLSIESKDVGGLGIFFMKNFVDKIEYEHKEGANVLTISKNIN